MGSPLAARYPIRGIFVRSCATENRGNNDSDSIAPTIQIAVDFRSFVVVEDCLLMTAVTISLDHLIRPRQYVRRNRQAYLLGGF
jgi:hypothetical protein